MQPLKGCYICDGFNKNIQTIFFDLKLETHMMDFVS